MSYYFCSPDANKTILSNNELTLLLKISNLRNNFLFFLTRKRSTFKTTADFNSHIYLCTLCSNSNSSSRLPFCEKTKMTELYP